MLIELIRSGLPLPKMIYMLVIYLFAMTLSFSIHEYMHAAAAVWLGDQTPKNMGRLTLNPIAHIDLTGIALILLAGFGWGKPVTYNPWRLNRFKSSRLMNSIVHVAGVTGNFVLAYISNLLALLFSAINIKFDLGAASMALTTLTELFAYTYVFSLMLLAFNLLPVAPLDGFHLLEEFLPHKFKASNGYRKYISIAPYILWILFLAGYCLRIPILDTIVSTVEIPFEKLINLLSMPFIFLGQAVGL